MVFDKLCLAVPGFYGLNEPDLPFKIFDCQALNETYEFPVSDTSIILKKSKTHGQIGIINILTGSIWGRTHHH